MRQRMIDYRVFWREFRQTFHSTGAVLPSGRRLARALAGRVANGQQPQRVLEVGPGTGAVTGHIIERLGPEDRLDLVELNERFADVLRSRLEKEAAWRAVADRVRVLEMPVEQIDAEAIYDVIVSGLPLNNFSCDLVQRIFTQFHRLAAKQARLSFFEYVAVRKAKSLFCKPSERRRLFGIERLLAREFDRWEVLRECVLGNAPPAWVHHLQLPGKGSRVESPGSRARSSA
ncbi:MAG: methyltransferase domain-containing protein [Planctomycetes bacterium]|nr:methyltransferase domain-containing protein [Planctomycetota bacterium]